jgi:hypothetical protein
MSNNFRPTTLERAYELARSGECRTVGDIKTRLQQEGHERVRSRPESRMDKTQVVHRAFCAHIGAVDLSA